MQNIVIKMCEKFHYDRLRNDRDLADQKSDNKIEEQRSSRFSPVSRRISRRPKKISG